MLPQRQLTEEHVRGFFSYTALALGQHVHGGQLPASLQLHAVTEQEYTKLLECLSEAKSSNRLQECVATLEHVYTRINAMDDTAYKLWANNPSAMLRLYELYAVLSNRIFEGYLPFTRLHRMFVDVVENNSRCEFPSVVYICYADDHETAERLLSYAREQYSVGEALGELRRHIKGCFKQQMGCVSVRNRHDPYASKPRFASDIQDIIMQLHNSIDQQSVLLNYLEEVI